MMNHLGIQSCSTTTWASPHGTEYIVFLLSYKFIPKILFPFQTYPERKFQVSVSALNCSENVCLYLQRWPLALFH